MTDDLILGIDFGMSCTGVAFVLPGHKGKGATVKTFQGWPGGPPGGYREKVPTILAYDVSHPRKLLTWGFNAKNHTTTPVNIEEWFKIRLGDAEHDQKHTKSLFRDYLSCVYTALEEWFSPSELQGISWQDAAIKFVFSVPTTWRLDVVEIFKGLVREAGFGRFEKHQVQVGLPEPHAVAAFELHYTSGQSLDGAGGRGPLKKGKPVLFVDAGGGTADFCVARVTETTPQQPSRLANMFAGDGLNIGSTYIDQGFRNLIESHLRGSGYDLRHDARDAAAKMCKGSDFEEQKHRFGPFNEVNLKIDVPDLEDPTIYSFSTLQNGILSARRCDLEPLFDAQVQKLIRKIDYATEYQAPGEEIRVEDIVLSGGLGSSAYVQHRLREHLCKGEGKGAILHISARPRLAVCHGLVFHALHGGAFHTDRSRVSFGLVCRIRKPRSLETTFQAIRTKNMARPDDGSFFDRWGPVLTQAKEKGRDKIIDSSGRTWIDNCVDWFVKKDQDIHVNKPIARKFSTFFPQDLPAAGRICYVRVVASTQPTPSAFGDGADVGTHSFLKVDLSSIPMHEVEEKNTDLLSQAIGKKPRVKVEFLIEATMGLAEAEVQCFDVGKQKVLSQVVHVIPDQQLSSGDSSHLPQTCIHATE